MEHFFISTLLGLTQDNAIFILGLSPCSNHVLFWSSCLRQPSNFIQILMKLNSHDFSFESWRGMNPLYSCPEPDFSSGQRGLQHCNCTTQSIANKDSGLVRRNRCRAHSHRLSVKLANYVPVSQQEDFALQEMLPLTAGRGKGSALCVPIMSSQSCLNLVALT